MPAAYPTAATPGRANSAANQLGEIARLAAFDPDERLLEELRHAAELYARELRARGESPEKVLIAIKEILQRATGVTDRRWTLPVDHGPEALIAQVVRWTVEGYYQRE